MICPPLLIYLFIYLLFLHASSIAIDVTKSKWLLAKVKFKK